jgi:hypothetical protein
VAVDAAATRSEAAAEPVGLAHAAAVPARLVLGGIVAVSAAIRFVAALAHTTPLYFPDEYIYTEISRGFAHAGRPLVRGSAAHFPAILEPLVTAPFAALGGPGFAFRATQGLNALAMSLAAVPVYLLARRLGLGKWFALGCALLAVACPDLFYVSFVLGEPIAYPLALAALYAGVCALARPTRRAQFAFLAFAALATLARAQYVVLVPAFFLAAAFVRRRAAVRDLRLTLVACALPLVVVVALGPSKALGYYAGIADLGVRPLSIAHWIGTDLMLLTYAAGWVLVPGALAGLAAALTRPRSIEERAFAALACALGGGLLAEAALYATNAGIQGGRFQERYLLVLLPLAAPAFGLYLRRARAARASVVVLSFALLTLSAAVPLAGYTSTTGRQDSPFLLGVYRLEKSVGVANGSLWIAAIVAALSICAAALAVRPRRAPLTAVVLSAVFLACVGVGAFSLDHYNATNARRTYLPADARWVDDTHVGPVTLLQTPGSPRELSLENLFWNTSVDRVVRLRRADVIDAFPQRVVRDAPSGALLDRGRPVRTSLLVPHYAVYATFANAHRVAGTELFDLWKPAGIPELRVLAGGHYYDNWLAASGYVRVYGSPCGTVSFTLYRPRVAPPAPLHLRAPGVDRTISLKRGERRTVVLRVDVQGVWVLRFKTTGGAYLSDGRAISVRSSVPVFGGKCGADVRRTVTA